MLYKQITGNLIMMGRRVFIPHLNMFGEEVEITIDYDYSECANVSLLKSFLQIHEDNEDYEECDKIKEQLKNLGYGKRNGEN